MALKGSIVADGSDGTDFCHREQIASHYQISSTFKNRLKLVIFLHFLLFFVVCAKVSANQLAQFGIFSKEIQDMEFPKTLLWEWIWLSSLVFAFLGYGGVRKNRVTIMKTYAWGIFIFAVCPIVVAAIQNLEDLLRYMQSDSGENSGVPMWKGMPVAALWYCFIGIAFQVHMLSIIFALKLIEAWTPKKAKQS